MAASFKFIVAFTIFQFFASPSFAQSEGGWKQTAQGEDYEIYQKPSAASSDLVAFRLIGILKGTPLEVATGILDRIHRLKWMRDIRELRTVRIPISGRVVEYSAIKTPFIIKDRDFVIQTDIEVDSVQQRVVVVSKSVTDDTVPLTSNVRGELKEGRFLIEPGPEIGTSRLTADIDLDPKGSVPRWIVNHFQKNWPIVMFRALKDFLGTKVSTLPEDLRPIFAPQP